MKKTILIFTLIALGGLSTHLHAQSLPSGDRLYIPDPVFVARLQSGKGLYILNPGWTEKKITVYRDGVRHYISKTEARTIPGIVFNNTAASADHEKIKDLTGIEGFTSLTYLSINYNLLASLDVSQNTRLVQLVVANNQLTALDVSLNTALAALDVRNNSKLSCVNVSVNQKQRLNLPPLNAESLAVNPSRRTGFSFDARVTTDTNCPTRPDAIAPAAPKVSASDGTKPLSLTGMRIADGGGDDQTVTFTVQGGTLTIGTAGITFGGGGNGTASFTAAGTLAAVNTALAAATFSPVPDPKGGRILAAITLQTNDGTVQSKPATLIFEAFPAPIISTHKQLNVAQGTTNAVAISTSHLQATDQTGRPGADQITFVLKAKPSKGTLKKSGTDLNIGGTFTQQDIDDGSITYTPNPGVSGRDAFKFTVHYGDDSFSSTQQTFTVFVRAANAPSAIALAKSTIAENSAAGTPIGTLSTTDLDPATGNPTSGHTYRLDKTYGDYAVFQIQSNTLQTAASTSFDYEGGTKRQYTIRIIVTDSDKNEYSEDFTITVTDMDEPPMISVNEPLELQKGAIAGIGRAHLLAIDPDEKDKSTDMTFTLKALPAHGVLKKSGVDLALGDAFTQQDIIQNKLSYLHDGGTETSDSFTFTLSQGSVAVPGDESFTINIIPAGACSLAPTALPAFCVVGVIDLEDAVPSTAQSTDLSYYAAIFPGTPLTGTSVAPSSTTASYYVKMTNAGSGCEVIKPIPITVKASPDITITPPSPICEGETIDLATTHRATTAAIHFLDRVKRLSNTIVSPKATTTYTLVASEGVCQTERSVTVPVIPSAFSYAKAKYAKKEDNPSPELSDKTLKGGVFSSDTEGLVFLDEKTGEINLAESTPGVYVITYTTPLGNCRTTYDFNYDFEVGALALEKPLTSDFTVSPVPTSDVLHLRIKNTDTGRVVIRLNTLLGHTVWELSAIKTHPSWEHSSDLSFLPQGVYMLEVIAQGQRWTRKVVKE